MSDHCPNECLVCIEVRERSERNRETESEVRHEFHILDHKCAYCACGWQAHCAAEEGFMDLGGRYREHLDG